MQKCLLLSSKSAKLSFSQEKLLTTHCHEPAHISHQWTCESVSGSHLRKRSDEENPQRCYDPSDDRDGTAGFRQYNLSSTRTNVRFLSSLGRLVLSSMLDAKEQGAQRPEESTIIPFSESRYRSSDVGRAHLQTGEAPSFISAPSGDIAHYTLLRKVVRQARHLCAQSAALMCLMGTPHTPLYARRTVRITGTSGRFPSPRKAAPTQRIMMPSSP